jgi:hypothetical protein
MGWFALAILVRSQKPIGVQKERQYFMLRHRLKSVLSAGPDEEA